MAELGWYSCRCILQESTLGLGGSLTTKSLIRRMVRDLAFFQLICAESAPPTWQMAAQADSHAVGSSVQVPCCIRPAASAAAAASSLRAGGGRSVRLIRCLSCASASGTPPFCFASFCERRNGVVSWVGDFCAILAYKAWKMPYF